MATTDPLITETQRSLAAFRGFVRQRNLTGWVRDRNAFPQYRRAFQAVLALEDRDGIDAAAKYGNRLDDLRREAMDRHLLSAGDVLRAEREVIG